MAINKINATPHKPDFIIHTGDLSQPSKPSEFDTLDQMLKGASAKQTYFVPGEHDMLTDNREQYVQRYGIGTRGSGWCSFDHKGVHFVGLVNVANLKAGGMGSLGHEQLEWFEDDLKGRSASTPIVLLHTFHCGPSTPIGAGEPTTANKHCLTSSASVP